MTTAAITRADSLARGPSYNKDRCRTLLVVDDHNTEWSKYFRGAKLPGDYDVRVEQAEFKELSITASSEGGALVSMAVWRGGTKVVRSFKPDFVLLRQNLRDADADHRSILLGLKYGEVGSVNSLDSMFAFADKPWVYAHLLALRRRLSRDAFPLIDQTYFPNHREMVTTQKFPVVLKIGHAHGGLGKVKVDNQSDFQDMASVVAVSGTYCTVEAYIDAKYDVHVQKIGNFYKAFIRKSISGSWKTNLGSSLLEQVPVKEHWKSWVNAVSSLFGGLDICAIEAIVSKDEKETIIEVNDCALTLLGDTQEEDRRHIAELVLFRMQQQNQLQLQQQMQQKQPPQQPQQPQPQSIQAQGTPSRQATHSAAAVASPTEEKLAESQQQPRRDSQGSHTSSVSTGSKETAAGPRVPPRPPADRDQADRVPPELPPRQSSVTSAEGPRGFFTRQTSQQATADEDDTMRNLRKTFAGIFGDM